MQMSQIPVGITLGSNALVDLENMNLTPGNLLGGEVLEHSPRGLAPTHGEGEDTAFRNSVAGGIRDHSGGRLGDRIVIGKNFDLHRFISSPGSGG